MSMTQQTRKDRQRGSVLIEASLIMLVALMVIIATFDFGQFLFFHQTLSERARFAARYGALNWDRGCDATCVQNIVVYRQPTVPANRIPSDGVVVPGLTTANVNVTIPNPTVQGWDARVIVTIQNYRFKVFTPWLSRAGMMTARALTATSPIEAPN